MQEGGDAVREVVSNWWCSQQQGGESWPYALQASYGAERTPLEQRFLATFSDDAPKITQTVEAQMLQPDSAVSRTLAQEHFRANSCARDCVEARFVAVCAECGDSRSRGADVDSVTRWWHI